jgi:hypothetical protein
LCQFYQVIFLLLVFYYVKILRVPSLPCMLHAAPN